MCYMFLRKAELNSVVDQVCMFSVSSVMKINPDALFDYLFFIKSLDFKV
jgi:hypothetical protein